MIKAITASGKIDPSGQLSLDYPIEGTPPKPVRVIILFDETDGEVNKFWKSVTINSNHSCQLNSCKRD
ncbi:hypothetical protein [Moorena sp. SIO4G3]|uniref:hypothetical protein n=1 Tax=Moorena sp. SIO4G3 TaxID=2607821 RepID=UPI0025FA0B65|nr:hypothetical protein [Moorena sp. SIO4G3]